MLTFGLTAVGHPLATRRIRVPDINDEQGTRNAGDTPQLIADRIDRAFRLVRIEHVVLSTVVINLRSNRRPSTEHAHNEDRRDEQ